MTAERLAPRSGRLITALCLALVCRILDEQPVRLVQDGPQRIEERRSWEWCTDQAVIEGRPTTVTAFLVERTFWVVDGRTLRNEQTDTPASHSRVLWSNVLSGGSEEAVP